MSHDEAAGGESEVDHEELRRKYHTDPATLPPHVRARMEAVQAKLAAMRATGIPPRPQRPGDNFAIGLDDNFQPFPESVGRHGGRDESSSAQD
jgi:hypothetical protein